MMTGRVLLLGRRPRVLDQLADALRREGLQVRQETDLDAAGTRIDGSTVDVVVLGRGVTGARRKAIVNALRAKNPACGLSTDWRRSRLCSWPRFRKRS